jgi:ribosome-associated protein
MKKHSSVSRAAEDRSLSLLRSIVQTLDDKKAEDLRVMDVRAQSSITDYLVLATGTSEPHLRALRVELEKTLDAAKAVIVGIESVQGSGWTVFDAFDVMVHVFTEDNRAKYRLELLWKDAADIPVPGLLAGKPAPRRRTRRAFATHAKRSE